MGSCSGRLQGAGLCSGLQCIGNLGAAAAAARWKFRLGNQGRWICRMLEQVECEGAISKSRAAEVQGHLNFAGGFFTFKGLEIPRVFFQPPC